jgi:hypothetical protein
VPGDGLTVTPRPFPGSIDHYAEAFGLPSQRRFRFIRHETGHPRHRPYITEWRGRFRDGSGTWHTFEAWDGHRTDLDALRGIG